MKMMKSNRINMLLAVALVTLGVFTACNKKNNGTNENISSFTAGIEQNEPSSRTYLIDEDIFWSEDDAIKVANSSNQQAEFTVDPEYVGTQTATFTIETEFEKAPEFIAAYPSSSATINYADGEVVFALPNTQTITTTGTFANGAMAMVAHDISTTLLFKNALGGICFPMKGSFKVSKLVLTAVDTDDMLWGQMTTGWNNNLPTVASITGGSNVITLQCSQPVQLNTTSSEEFYIMLPPGSLEKGFNLKVYDENNTVKYNQTLDWSASPFADFIIRSKVRKPGEFNVDPASYTIQVQAANTGGSPYINAEGTVAATFEVGQTCTIHANPASGYQFVNWTKEGDTSFNSTDADLTVTVDGDATYVAHYNQITYTITVVADPTAGGTVYINSTGTTSLSVTPGTSVTIYANPANGYAFENWTTSDLVLYGKSKTVTVNGNITYTAKFWRKPTGALDGFYSVSDTKKVFFSQGNLQYNNGGVTWRFAPNQWDRIGNDGGQYTSESTGARDVFAWAMNGRDHRGGYGFYMPYHQGLYAGGYYPNACLPYQNPSAGQLNTEYDLSSSTGQADWGYNAISNGGNTVNYGWRTLTYDEWDYLLNRNTTLCPNGSWRVVTYNTVFGLLLLPDGFDALTINNGATLNDSQWAILTSNGAAFLPAAGASTLDIAYGGNWTGSGAGDFHLQNGNPQYDRYNEWGYYWASTHSTSASGPNGHWYNADCMLFNNVNNQAAAGQQLRNNRYCVRLAMDVGHLH